ncbi:unnamed protein product [Penicillium salamii]|uniref:Nephrocystin 3-like N-terminal domain-containing protein n=1 Tax=Penicillium salamii TaxID=1612424 RepID=A0A9W4P0H5_9EURO|nr:unnamed protein product [Penicillium salamii]
MPRGKFRSLFRKKPSEEGQTQTNLPLRNGNQDVDDSTQDPSESVNKPDLWQRAYDDLEPKEQQLLQRITIPKSDEFPEPIDANVDPSVVDRLKALNWVVETVKIQYEIDKEKSKIKEPIHKILQATLSFQDVIKAFAAFDPTGHAPKAWAVVSLGLTVSPSHLNLKLWSLVTDNFIVQMTQNHRSQKEAWLESCVYLTDILARYAFVEAEYHKDPNTDHHVETAIVQVYVAVLTFAAKVQSRVDSNRAVLFGKSILGNTLADLEESIHKAESNVGQWLEVVDRREHRGRGEDLVKKVDTILNEFERVMGSLDELHGKFDLSGLKTAQEARYNANTGEEYQECLPETRVELLKEIKLWATHPDQKATFWLQGMAGTGKSTVSRTVARWLDKEGLLGGSFFFKKNGTDRDNAKRLFTTLTKQMLERLPHLRGPVQSAIKETPSIVEGRRLQEQFNELLFKPLQSLDLGLNSPLILVIVIDALDECQVPEDIKAFLSTLPQLNRLKTIQLRVFITSRPEIPVIRGLHSVNHEEIILHEIEESIIKHDIAAFFHEKLKCIRDYYGLEQFWPGEEALLALVNMATPLFIYAATICRFVDSELPRKRLRAVLSTPLSGGKSGIDDEYAMLASLYSSVLKDIVSGKRPMELKEFMDDFQQIVGAIVMLFSPLSSAALSELIQLEKETTQGRLSTLRSVLSVPRDGDETTPIQLLHLSFREFLVSRPASTDFWIDEEAAHTKLAVNCLDCMKQSLTRDICHLSSPGVRNHEVEKTTVDNHISPGLQYACRYWIRHLKNSDESTIDWEMIENFFKLHLLHWLEALSLLGWISEAIENIHTLQSLAKVGDIKPRPTRKKK